MALLQPLEDLQRPGTEDRGVSVLVPNVHLVTEGYLEVYARQDKGPNAGRRKHMCRVGKGEIAIGLPPARQNRTGMSFVALPSPEARIVEIDRTEFAPRHTFDIDSVIRLDDWVNRLTECAANAETPIPRSAVLMETDEENHYPASTDLGSHSGDVLCVTADRPVHLLGIPELEVAAGHPVAVGERVWIRLVSRTRLSVKRLPESILDGTVWLAVDQLAMYVAAHAKLQFARADIAYESRFEESARASRETFDETCHRLAMVLEPRRERTWSAVSRSPLFAAAQSVCASMGLEVQTSPANESTKTDLVMQVETLLAGTDVRARKITLEPRWWRKNGPSFVGFTMGRGLPLGVLCKGSGEYRAVDPSRGTSFRIGRREAAQVAPSAIMLYVPLPEGAVTPRVIIREAIRGRAGDLRAILAMSALAALVSLTTPVLTGKLLAEVIPRTDLAAWTAILAAMLVAAISGGGFEIVRAFATLRLEGRIDERLQAAFWSRLLSRHLRLFRNYTAGEITHRINSLSDIRLILTGATTGAALGGIFAAISYILLFYYSWMLALLTGVFIVVLVGVSFAIGRIQMSHYRAAYEIQGKLDGFLFQVLSGVSKIRMAKSEVHAFSRWSRDFAGLKRRNLQARQWAAAQVTLNGTFLPVLQLALFAFVWYQLVDGSDDPKLSLAGFLSFSAVVGQFGSAATGVASSITVIVEALSLFERVQPMLEAPVDNPPGRNRPVDMKGDIQFEDVSFSYRTGHRKALDQISFRIRQGEFVAFVGASGSGKSTILHLLLGFDQPNRGAIFLDGEDLAYLDLRAVREHMGVVLQSGQPLAESILQNIAFPWTLTLEEAWAAARAANLEEEIRKMPMGMNTVLPENGEGLSGGQKQRLLIARALARRPRMLLLDEATSALDNRTQAHVQASLRSLSATRIVVAHRLSTVQDADRIYVMSEGRIVESGTYRKLLEIDGAFAALARRQEFS